MDCVGASSEMNWSSFNALFSADETEFLSQFLGSCPSTVDPVLDLSFGLPAAFRSSHEATNMVLGDNYNSYDHCLDAFESSLNCLPQGNNDGLCIPSSHHEHYCIVDPNLVPEINGSISPTDHCGQADEGNTSSLLGILPENMFEETVCLNDQELIADDSGEPAAVNPSERSLLNQKPQRKRKTIDKLINERAASSTSSKKKTRVTGDVRRNASRTHSKKNNQKVNEIADALNFQSSSADSSEEDSIDSQEMSGGMTSTCKGSPALNSNGRTRASRGSATDPKSLYARKRRERTNQRLKILQNLVPNGTKVDISTMLEEAVLYVKFLQLQIKLLSSDDLWMYTPIAYNGKDIGLDL